MTTIPPSANAPFAAFDGAPAGAWDRRDVPALLRLDEVAPDLFRNRFNQRNLNAALYGGQVVAQALAATLRTTDRPIHSLHAYFLRAGRADTSVLFAVDRTRDGGNFSTRRVSAIQNGKILLEMVCSFTEGHPGDDEQVAMGQVPMPEDLTSLRDLVCANPEGLTPFARTFANPGPVELKPMSREEITIAGAKPDRQFWFRVPGAAGITDQAAAAEVIAYLSDFWLSSTVLTRNTGAGEENAVFVASIDHAVWFHRPVTDAGDWFLYRTECPSVTGSLMMRRGLIFDRVGRLVASTAQEVLQAPR